MLFMFARMRYMNKGKERGVQTVMNLICSDVMSVGGE